MDLRPDNPAAIYSLTPDLSRNVLRYLSKHCQRQFAVCNKHTHMCTLSAVSSLVLSHKCLSARKPLKLNMMKNCSTVTLRPRTMDELTNLAALLLVHNLQHLPSLSCLRLELLNVYDKQCDVSLILKSVVLHAKHLTHLVIQEEAQVSLKAMAAAAELPLLERLEVKTRNGFEAGALGQLSRAVNLTALHLEVLAPDGGSGGGRLTGGSSQLGALSPLSPAAASPSSSPQELARLQAADEVGLAKMGGQLLSFAAIGLSTPSGMRPITALLAAVAGSPRPRMLHLQLGELDVQAHTLALVASITSLMSLQLLPGCELLAAPMDLSRLTALSGLTQLVVGPCMPPAPVMSALARSCRRLCTLGVSGQPGPLPLAMPMPGVTSLQLLGAARRGHQRTKVPYMTGATGSRGSSTWSSPPDLGNLAITLTSPLSLSGLALLWPRLVCLEVSGWALDAGSVAVLRELDSLTWLKLQGGKEPGTALHAHMLLPLLTKPNLHTLMLLEASDLNDAWVMAALRLVIRPSKGYRSGVRDLHLGAAQAVRVRAVSSASNGLADDTRNGLLLDGSSIAMWSSSPGSLESGGSSGGPCTSTVTDEGLVKLGFWPQLQSLVLFGLPGISLAGVKAMVAGSMSLGNVYVQSCPAVSAAPPDIIAKVGTGAGGCVVNLWVS